MIKHLGVNLVKKSEIFFYTAKSKTLIKEIEKAKEANQYSVLMD